MSQTGSRKKPRTAEPLGWRTLRNKEVLRVRILASTSSTTTKVVSLGDRAMQRLHYPGMAAMGRAAATMCDLTGLGVTAEVVKQVKKPSLLRPSKCLPKIEERLAAPLACLLSRLVQDRSPSLPFERAMRASLGRAWRPSARGGGQRALPAAGQGGWFMTRDPAVNPAAELIGDFVLTPETPDFRSLRVRVAPAVTENGGGGTRHPFIYEVIILDAATTPTSSTPRRSTCRLAGVAFGVGADIGYLSAQDFRSAEEADLRSHLERGSRRAWSVLDAHRDLAMAPEGAIDAFAEDVAKLWDGGWNTATTVDGGSPGPDVIVSEAVKAALYRAPTPTPTPAPPSSAVKSPAAAAVVKVPTLALADASAAEQALVAAVWASRIQQQQQQQQQQQPPHGGIVGFSLVRRDVFDGARKRLLEMLPGPPPKFERIEPTGTSGKRRNGGGPHRTGTNTNRCAFCERGIAGAGPPVGPKCRQKLAGGIDAVADATDAERAELRRLLDADPVALIERLRALEGDGRLNLAEIEAAARLEEYDGEGWGADVDAFGNLAGFITDDEEEDDDLEEVEFSDDETDDDEQGGDEQNGEAVESSSDDDSDDSDNDDSDDDAPEDDGDETGDEDADDDDDDGDDSDSE